MKNGYIRFIIQLLTVLTFTVSVKASGPIDSIIDRRAQAISEQLARQIRENERLIKEGKGAAANYIVFDNYPSGNYLFTEFTSTNARRMWLQKPLLKRISPLDDIQTQTFQLNSWISDLHKTYLENTPYKDYKIYFVLSGIYNYDNVESKEPDIKWQDQRLISFHNTIKTDPSTSVYTEKESKIFYSVFNKVAAQNSGLGELIKKDKNIICFVYCFYQYRKGNETIFTWLDDQGKWDISKMQVIAPKAFVVTGTYRSPQVPADLIRGFNSYHNNHLDEMVGDQPQDLATRGDYLTQRIRNAFTYFSTLGNGMQTGADCANDQALRTKLEALYKNPLPNSTASAALTLKDFTLETRKCLLQLLSESGVCGDKTNWAVEMKACENMIVDIIASTPQDQRRLLLDYLNENNNNVLWSIISKVHDEGPGKYNYSAVVNLLCQYAYDAYSKDVSMIQASDEYCSWSSYNPETKFNDYSFNVLAEYTEANKMTFTLRNYDGNCYTKVMDGNGQEHYTTRVLTGRPFDFVGIIPEVDLSVKFSLQNQQQNTLNQRILVPALMLHWNVKRSNTITIKRELEIAVQGATFFWGGGTVIMTGTRLARALMAAEGVATFANVVANTATVKDYIIRQEGGQEFLTTINEINGWASLSNVSYLTLARLGRAIKTWRTIRASREVSSAADFAQMDDRMTQLENAMAEDGLITTKKTVTQAASSPLEVLFSAVWNNPWIDNLKELAKSRNVTISLWDETWAADLLKWRKEFQIGAKRNMARMMWRDENGVQHDLLLASGAGYTDQMRKDSRFLRKEFIDEIDNAGRGTFAPEWTTKHIDSESLGLNWFARTKKAKPGNIYPEFTDEITLYSDLCPCWSCQKMLRDFLVMFPNAKLNIITSTKLTY